MTDVLTLFAAAATILVAFRHAARLALVALGGRELRRERRAAAARPRAAPGPLPGVSVLIAARDEERTVADAVRSVLGSGHPGLEVLVVDDGSTDGTAATVAGAFGLERAPLPELPALRTRPLRSLFTSSAADLRLLVKEPGGKADALNAGLLLARRPLVLVLDADTVIEPGALEGLTRAFVDDPRLVAASGALRLRRGRRSLAGRILERFQELEYLRDFNLGRLAWNPWNAHLILPGAFALFRRATLLELGGFRTGAPGEDLELVLRLHRRLRGGPSPYRTRLVPGAVARTRAARDLRQLARQRLDWQRGLMNALARHRASLLRPRLGTVGLVALPVLGLLELVLPILELAGWALLPAAWIAGRLPDAALAGFLAAAVALPAAVSLTAVAFESRALGGRLGWRGRLGLTAAALLEPFGYHQLLLALRGLALFGAPRPSRRDRGAGDETPDADGGELHASRSYPDPDAAR